MCCPGRQDPCGAPVQPGNGQYSQRRWYFDRETKACRQFTYRGQKGNQASCCTWSNGDCHLSLLWFIIAASFSRTTFCRNSIVNRPVQCSKIHVPYSNFQGDSNSVQQYPSCSITNPNCPATSWCHFGLDAKTTVCCPNGKSRLLVSTTVPFSTKHTTTIRNVHSTQHKHSINNRHSGISSNISLVLITASHYPIGLYLLQLTVIYRSRDNVQVRTCTYLLEKMFDLEWLFWCFVDMEQRILDRVL